MVDQTAPDWAAIERRYVETDDRVEDICAEEGITSGQLATQRKKHGWRRSNPRPFGVRRAQAAANPAAGEAALIPPVRPRKAASGTADGRKRLLNRLVAAISLKLEQLERRMNDDLEAPGDSSAHTSTDHERETRAIGALLDNLGKITEMESGYPRRPGKAPVADAAAIDLGHEADRYRRELAERLQKIVEAAEGKS
jgi:hypothetical protein